MYRGGGQGMDGGSRGSGGHNGYRRDYQNRSGYGRDSDNSNTAHRASGNGYDHISKSDQGTYSDRGGRRGGDDGGRQNGQHSHNGHSNNGDMIPQELIASLEKNMASVHTDMSQALADISGKENEKFDLIFGILIELQRRQAQLEESVRSLKTQFPAPAGGMGQMQPQPPLVQGQSQPASQGQQSINGQGQMNSQANGQMFMPNQMSMGQQYGNMVNPDGSQAFFTNMQQMPANVVLVAAPGGVPPQGMQQMPPQGMQQMSYAMPQMMSGPMQPQMAMQFVSQDQSANNFQPWGQGGAAEQAQQPPAPESTNGAQVPVVSGDKPTECLPEGNQPVPPPALEEE